MSNKVTFPFATPSLTTLKANFIAEVSGQIVRASNGSMLANNSTNRPLAAVIGAWNAGLGQYTFQMPDDAPNGNYRGKIWFNPTWVDDEPEIGLTNILIWDGADLTDSGEADTLGDQSITFEFELKIDGVPADADQPPVLSDADASYGIKRLDSGAVVVAAGTALIHDDAHPGQYSYTITDPVPGVTYRASFQYVIDGVTFQFTKEITAAALGDDQSGYLTLREANALAATMPGLASYNAADATARANALIAATERIDVAMRYQGRKYDPNQTLQFPRVAYGSNIIGPILNQPYPLSSLVADSIWDWDRTTNAAIVPPKVKRACLIEADSIIAGTRAGRMDAQHDGLASQAIGSASEAYFQGSGEKPALCRAAHELMNYYRLRSGSMT